MPDLKHAMRGLLGDEPNAGVDVASVLVAGRTARRARRVRTAAVAAVVAAGVAGLLPFGRHLIEQPSPPVSRVPSVKLVLFQTDLGMSIARSDGKAARAFLHQGGRIGHADWSPNGQQVMFVRDDPGQRGDIWVADRDGRNQRVVVDCEAPCTYAEDPAWSPDGRQVAYWTNGTTETTQVIRVADVRSGRVVNTITAPDLLAPVNPRWSPDGRTLAVAVSRFAADGSGNLTMDGSAVGVIDLRASAPALRQITDFTARATYPAWSPAGDRILFVGGNLDPFSVSSPGQTDLFTVGPDGSRLTQLTQRAAADERLAEPDWPSGDQLLAAAVSPTDGVSHLVSLAPNGTGLRALIDAATGQPLIGRHPRLDPDLN